MSDEAKVEATEETPAVPANVSEADLAKSLAELEGKAQKETPAEPAKPTVTATKLEKNTQDAIQQNGSQGLRRSLEVSQVLNEFSSVIADHVDESLATLEKSVNAAAERDYAIINVLTNLQKSIATLADKIEEYGDKPAAAPKSTQLTKSDVLQKSVETEEKPAAPAQNREQVRASVQNGLVELMKATTPGSQEAGRIQQAALVFESTGQIDDNLFQKAIAASRKVTV